MSKFEVVGRSTAGHSRISVLRRSHVSDKDRLDMMITGNTLNYQKLTKNYQKSVFEITGRVSIYHNYKKATLVLSMALLF